MSLEVIPVGLGELKLSKDSGSVLTCYGLGSCVGVAAFDPVARVAGMAHVVLPDSGASRDARGAPLKFADAAVPHLLAELVRLGAMKSRLVVKLAGGARMLQGLSGAGGKLDIGHRNIEAVHAALERASTRVTAEDVGGSHGRTLQLFVAAGQVRVSTVGRGEHEL